MVNRVILVGRLGADPELRYTPSGQALAKFNVATDEVFTDRQGERQKRTEWHRIVAWGKLAETCGKYLTKGQLVYIEGRIRSNTWEQEGVKRTYVEIIASNMQMLSSGRGPEREVEPPFPPPEGGPPEEDIPF